ncbi:MAG: Gfo/Idh/MocA family oxidoreductase [Bryobacteraceae bacterium]
MRVGVIGLGFMGATHLNAFRGIDGVEIAAVSSKNRKALEGDLSGAGGNLGREAGVFDFSAVSKFADWHDLLEDPSVDAVDICLPTYLHLEATVLALEAGKHVLVEKPMALDGAQCDAILGAAGRSKQVLMVAQVLRFWPEYIALRKLLQSGVNGPVREAVFSRRCGLPDWSAWLSDESRSGGAVLDLLAHDIDQALHLFGLPDSVSAGSLGPVDTLGASLRYRDGSVVSIHGGWYPAGEPFSMGFRVAMDSTGLELKDSVLREKTSGEWRSIASPPGDAYQAELSYFIDCCRSGSRPVECLPLESARAVKLALLLKESRRQGGTKLPCSI